MNFLDTQAGYNFCNYRIPRLIEAIEELTKELKRNNDLKEKELKTQEEKKDI